MKMIKTEVIVLSTLHQFHDSVKRYDFAKLSEIIESLAPDVLAVEVTPSDLEQRKEQKIKQEYQKSVFPLLERHNFVVISLEPAEPKFSELIKLKCESEAQEIDAEKGEAFGNYVSALLKLLLKTWDSPAAVNSPLTDSLFASKHALQNEIYGAKEQRSWDGWNQYFLDVILQTVQNCPGKRLLILVGVEPGYWLRKRLKKYGEVNLLDTTLLLNKE